MLYAVSWKSTKDDGEGCGARLEEVSRSWEAMGVPKRRESGELVEVDGGRSRKCVGRADGRPYLPIVVPAGESVVISAVELVSIKYDSIGHACSNLTV